MKKILSLHLLFILGTIPLLAQGGLKAEYFDGTEFNRYVATNTVNHIDFYWNQTPPVEGINPHKCSVRYTGRLKSPKTGTYAFSARVDDGIRVWIGKALVINNWKLNDVGYSEGRIQLEADQFYDIKIEYFNALNEAELRLLWTLPNDDDKSWFDQWFDYNKPVVIPPQNFTLSLEQEIEVVPDPILEPIAEAKPESKPKVKPTPKTKVRSKPKVVQQKPVVVPIKKKVSIDTIQQYIPKNVAFNRAESEILPISFPELDKLADFLAKNPTRKVRIEGHTDNIGDMEKNFRLSERRAYAVAAYLVKKGANSEQLSARGFGGTKPLVRSSGNIYNPENRRVAFIIE